MDTITNMRFYEAGRVVPQEAQKQFSNGKFSGTDINPMWRIKKLTELFGPAGIGWYYKVLSERCEQHADVTMSIVDLELYIKVDGEWSMPIYGTGGNQLVKSTTKGQQASDEGYKMALTDALSVACKALGIGADIYFERDKTKYTAYEGDAPKQTAKPPVQDVPECQRCHAPILSRDPNITPQQLAETRRLMTKGPRFPRGLRLCDDCYDIWLKSDYNKAPAPAQQSMEGVAEE